MPNQQPEQEARQIIDQMLEHSGWIVQDYKDVNLGAASGIVLRDVPLQSGECDYLILIDRKPVGIIEAKKPGTTLSGVAEQSTFYTDQLPDFLNPNEPLPFCYESTGIETYFCDRRDPDYRSRRVFSFHRPETLVKWLTEEDTLRARLKLLPNANPLKTQGMRKCQVEAITNLEQSFSENHPRALIQMATGAGKTYTACSFIYRLIKHADAKRVLFLVDRGNLGRQARDEFDRYVTPDTNRKFTELYNVQRMASNSLDSVCRVTICTIQRLYSILCGEELDEDMDDLSAGQLSAADERPKEVAYNPKVPIEYFDFIVTDECHRSIYNLWRQVLEYFDAFVIGLTATPSKQTIGFFNQNLIAEYSHERAVVEGVNVGYEVYSIRTQVTQQGSRVEKGFYVDRRSKQDRSRRLELLDEDLVYTQRDVDQSVVVPSQIRTVLQTYKDVVFTELFPGRSMLPKTLIFAKDDNHAEDIVQICREVFGKGNDFCKKITYKTYNPETKRYERSDQLIQEFRTSPQLRIAVTVDMIATGTDIKPLEVLLFMRDVKSRTYFEQMKGRGTRVLSSTELQSVSGADAKSKTQFYIVDAVGVCESDKTDSRPLERKRSMPFDKLVLGVAMGKRDEDTLTTLAGRLTKLEQEISPEQRKQVLDVTGHTTLPEMASRLLAANNPDTIAEKATGKKGASPAEVTEEQFEKTRQKLITEACAPFDQPIIRDTLIRLRKQLEQVIDEVTIDSVSSQGFDAQARERAEGLVRSFHEYIEQNKAEITALQILYSRPYRQRLTEALLKELENKLKENHAAWTEETIWNAFALARPEKVKGRSQVGRFADLVSLVRFDLAQQPVLKPFTESVAERFNEWMMDKAKVGITFNQEQLAWLNLIRDHIATSLTMEINDFDYAPFSQQGGLGKAYQVFGEGLDGILEELNEKLVA